MRLLTRVVAAVTILTASSCTRTEPDAESESAGDSGANEDGSAKPMALTDARLDKYLAFRRELNQGHARWSKGAVDLAKSVDSRSTDVAKGITAAAGIQRLGEKHEKEITALRAQHGFTEEEDERLWSALTEVVAAKALDNPMMGDGLKMYREMQARGGEEKKVADDLLKGLEEEEKQGLAEARARYGDACVDVLEKRVKELGQFQLDSVKQLTGQLEPGAK